MAMQMQRAFNSKFLYKLTLYEIGGGAYDANNNWVANAYTSSTIYGRVTVGNKFSQFGEGIAIKTEDGGVRTSDHRSLYITNKYSVAIGDKLTFRGVHYNILQQSDEEVFGFHSYLLEKSKGWTP